MLIALCLSVLCGCWGPAVAQQSRPGIIPGIIDVHAHLAPDKQLKFDKALEAAVKTMDRFGVATSIMMSPPRTAGVKQNYDAADFKAALDRYPGRFQFLAGGGTLNPMLHRHADAARVTPKARGRFIAKAKHLIDEGALGFGEMSSLHISLTARHGYTFVPADHPLMLALADIAAERDVPIDLHMDAVASQMPTPAQLARFPKNPKTFPETISALERLLSHNPQAKIVWAHAGTDHLGDFDPQTIGRLMARHANLFLSLKVTGPRAPTKNRLFTGNAVEPAWRSLLMRYPDRFVIGTDNFYISPRSKGGGPMAEFSKVAIPRLEATVAFLSLLPADLSRKIARDNALRLYRLKDEQAPEMLGTSQAKPNPPSKQQTLRCGKTNRAQCEVACARGNQQACARLRKVQ